MSKFEKAKERIRLKPNDYTFAQASFLLSQMGFVSSKNKGSNRFPACFEGT